MSYYNNTYRRSPSVPMRHDGRQTPQRTSFSARDVRSQPGYSQTPSRFGHVRSQSYVTSSSPRKSSPDSRLLQTPERKPSPVPSHSSERSRSWQQQRTPSPPPPPPPPPHPPHPPPLPPPPPSSKRTDVYVKRDSDSHGKDSHKPPEIKHKPSPQQQSSSQQHSTHTIPPPQVHIKRMHLVQPSPQQRHGMSSSWSCQGRGSNSSSHSPATSPNSSSSQAPMLQLPRLIVQSPRGGITGLRPMFPYPIFNAMSSPNSLPLPNGMFPAAFPIPPFFCAPMPPHHLPPPPPHPLLASNKPSSSPSRKPSASPCRSSSSSSSSSSLIASASSPVPSSPLCRSSPSLSPSLHSSSMPPPPTPLKRAASGPASSSVPDEAPPLKRAKSEPVIITLAPDDIWNTGSWRTVKTLEEQMIRAQREAFDLSLRSDDLYLKCQTSRLALDSALEKETALTDEITSIRKYIESLEKGSSNM